MHEAFKLIPESTSVHFFFLKEVSKWVLFLFFNSVSTHKPPTLLFNLQQEDFTLWHLTSSAGSHLSFFLPFCCVFAEAAAGTGVPGGAGGVHQRWTEEPEERVPPCPGGGKEDTEHPTCHWPVPGSCWPEHCHCWLHNRYHRQRIMWYKYLSNMVRKLYITLLTVLNSVTSHCSNCKFCRMSVQWKALNLH